MPENIVVSIIIVNWNGLSFLKECIFSIQKQLFKHYEIIVVDNGSTDGSVAFIENEFPFVELIKNKNNLGFAKAVNQGIYNAKGKYIALLNNDTVVDPHWVSEMIKLIESDDKIGSVTSKILKFDDSKIIDSIGLDIFPDGMSRSRGNSERDCGQYDKVEEILIPSGCSSLYRKKMLEEIGLFDEDFFAYCEDSDLGLRARIAGWRSYYAPTSIIYHKSSSTTGKASPLKAYYVERNRIWVAFKNFPPGMIIKMPIYSIFRYLVIIAGLFRKKGTSGEYVQSNSCFSLLIILIKSHFDALRKLPKMIRKRKKINNLKIISNADLKFILNKFAINVHKIV